MSVGHTKQILVVNGKGGCGKTTIATNLAAAYACRGHSVVLKDQDSQASASHWHAQRADKLAKITLVASHLRNAMYETRAFQTRSLVASEYVIIDSPSVLGDVHYTDFLRHIDAILVPVLPSSFDIRVSSRFLANLLTHRNYRARPIPVGVIANRVRQNSANHDKLVHFLECLDVPAVATLSDANIYTTMADQGTGMLDPCNKARTHKDMEQWASILDWLDEQVSQGAGQKVRTRGPQSADRKQGAPGRANYPKGESQVHA